MPRAPIDVDCSKRKQHVIRQMSMPCNRSTSVLLPSMISIRNAVVEGTLKYIKILWRTGGSIIVPLRTFCYNIKNGTDSASAHFDVSSRKNTLYTLLFLVTHCLIHVCMCLFCPPQFRFQSLPAPRHIPAGSDRLRLSSCRPIFAHCEFRRW